jgi:hypothetical protein
MIHALACLLKKGVLKPLFSPGSGGAGSITGDLGFARRNNGCKNDRKRRQVSANRACSFDCAKVYKRSRDILTLFQSRLVFLFGSTFIFYRHPRAPSGVGSISVRGKQTYIEKLELKTAPRVSSLSWRRS